MCVIVAVVSLSAQQVELLLSLSSLRLIDLTLYVDDFIISGGVVEGCLTEALVGELAVHEGALLSCCFCAVRADGLLDAEFHIVIHTHGHPCCSTADFEESKTIGESAFLVELFQRVGHSLLNVVIVVVN